MEKQKPIFMEAKEPHGFKKQVVVSVSKVAERK
jgi:hypothetical protein